MYEASSACIHNLNYPIDDYGNLVMNNIPFFSWVYSTCTYGGFGAGIAEEMCQDI